MAIYTIACLYTPLPCMPLYIESFVRLPSSLFLDFAPSSKDTEFTALIPTKIYSPFNDLTPSPSTKDSDMDRSLPEKTYESAYPLPTAEHNGICEQHQEQLRAAHRDAEHFTIFVGAIAVHVCACMMIPTFNCFLGEFAKVWLMAAWFGLLNAAYALWVTLYRRYDSGMNMLNVVVRVCAGIYFAALASMGILMIVWRVFYSKN
ncbi:hypothetical protein LTR37_015063 [Vermiconidia calcicola]|uniref:Uncharacterized protein n=1 Tax=Vermiconidia calcicola TaxID=1690605 RepID=A0ACC3MRV9_9PEZI|nr:hypothetical protein LTR37_015063 [Vermiconidia calcicola]